MKNQIYIHIPFCAAKCNYCAFNSRVAFTAEREEYADMLIAEITNFEQKKISVATIYFGGGTPTILSLNQLKKIFDAVQKKFHVEGDAEITIETNPGTVDENFLRGLREIGFNRLSIGVQSFDDATLKILGRIHDSKAAIETVTAAKKFFDNISVDLMYALPNQTLDDVKADVEQAARLDVQHISIYGLEVEPNTKFFELAAQKKLELPDENLCGDMYEYITRTLPTLGYNRYEVSNFAKAGFESRHNTGYWTSAKYFGFGAGAHSYDGNFRKSNVADFNEYIKKIRAGSDVSQIEEVVTERAAMEEFCFLGLRMTRGIDAKNFFDRFGKNFFEVYGKVIEKNLRLGLLEVDGDRIFLTERGMELSNVVSAEFILNSSDLST
ncbi:MAG: radical SAM family heme chaperone HemW [Selenomonadaceae bacterium]|nr:radical SAM family heme chaperone HemW [Selenomonadaceae bacterium]